MFQLLLEFLFLKRKDSEISIKNDASCQSERSRRPQRSKNMNFYYVYNIKCSDGSYYTGITNNINKRFIEQDNGKYKNCYTYKRRPLKLKFQESFLDVLQAIYFEKKIKGWNRSKKEALINGEFDRLQYLSECRNATHHKYHNKSNPNT